MGDVSLRRHFVKETLCGHRRFAEETFCMCAPTEIVLVLRRRRFVEETFCQGDVLSRRRYVLVCAPTEIVFSVAKPQHYLFMQLTGSSRGKKMMRLVQEIKK
jgi:hypothetical protein